MANHKWMDLTTHKNNKQHRCKKCGVYRDWIGGDMQVWKYWHPRKSFSETVKYSFQRPECRKR